MKHLMIPRIAGRKPHRP